MTYPDILEQIDVDSFKEYFPYDFPYLKVFDPDIFYHKNDEVVYIDSDNFQTFFVSLINKNKTAITSENWQEIEDSEKNYITDKIIEKALFQAKEYMKNLLYLFQLPDENNLVVMLTLYLAAFFVDLDYKAQMSADKLSQEVKSKSVDGVAVSYGEAPNDVLKPILKDLYDNVYGKKFLMYLLPRANASINIVAGTTSFM